eukprot:6086527-Pleurochrysis_carterae.AAC.1
MSLHVDDLIWRGRMDQYAQAITFCCVQVCASQGKARTLSLDSGIKSLPSTVFVRLCAWPRAQAAETLGDRCRVLKIDADEEPEVASALAIQGLPTVSPHRR